MPVNVNDRRNSTPNIETAALNLSLLIAQGRDTEVSFKQKINFSPATNSCTFETDYGDSSLNISEPYEGEICNDLWIAFHLRSQFGDCSARPAEVQSKSAVRDPRRKVLLLPNCLCVLSETYDGGLPKSMTAEYNVAVDYKNCLPAMKASHQKLTAKLLQDIARAAKAR